jgi:type IV pilus assembly protein PilV
MKRKNGFTLIEVLIAITVFAVGILAVSVMQIKATGSNARSQNITTAATLAAEQVERILAMKYDDVDDSDPSPVAVPPGFTAKWAVDEDIPIKRVKKVTITVRNTMSLFSTKTELVYYKGEGV